MNRNEKTLHANRTTEPFACRDRAHELRSRELASLLQRARAMLHDAAKAFAPTGVRRLRPL
ncbi:MAG: hypothetical protein JSW68_04375 [Burkholderiales bacterium]|nr:MAG: hypothetical protein JSW68_04375 [Burkholderiales bacterium]